MNEPHELTSPIEINVLFDDHFPLNGNSSREVVVLSLEVRPLRDKVRSFYLLKEEKNGE